MSRLHLLTGLAGLVTFILTGAYMHFEYDHLHSMSDAQRLLFRSTHIYVLLTALVNLGMGMGHLRYGGWQRGIAWLGSCIVLLTPWVALAAFFTEPWLTELARPYTRVCIYGCLAGMMFHLLAWAIQQWKTPRHPQPE